MQNERLTIVLPAKLKTALAVKAARERTTMSELVLAAIRAQLNLKDEPNDTEVSA